MSGSLVDNLLAIVGISAIALIAATFVSMIGFIVYSIRNTDYSDQTGWMNFAKPFLGIALLVLSCQAVVVGILILYLLFK